ncbi:hypothetical protein PENTCL1PPCAC_13227, partial [Pristionchus entomophagus]
DSLTAHPRPALPSFLGYGCLVVIIEECGSWDSDYRDDWVHDLSQMVRSVLSRHPEWWTAVKKVK